MRGLTLITISRALRRGPEHLPISLDSITGESTAFIKKLDSQLLSKVISIMKLPKIVIKDLGSKDHKIFCSSGPDGTSTSTALKTLSKFTKPAMDALLRLTGNKGRLYLRLSKFSSLMHADFGDIRKQFYTDPSIRKLALVEDPELKARIVAIFDHYSQNVLNMLSKQVFDILRLIPSDRTFSQEPRFNHPGFIENSDSY